MRSLFLPKYRPKIWRVSALPSNKLPGQKFFKFLVGILGETIRDLINPFSTQMTFRWKNVKTRDFCPNCQVKAWQTKKYHQVSALQWIIFFSFAIVWLWRRSKWMKGRQTFVQEDLCPNCNLKARQTFAKRYNQESALQWIPFRKRYHSKLACRSWGRQWQP